MQHLAMSFEQSGQGCQLVASQKPIPEPKQGEVRVRVVAAGISRADLELSLDSNNTGLIPGHDFAGVVDALGPNAGTSLRKGDKVWGTCKPEHNRSGAFAEHVCISSNAVGPVPAKLLFEEAAAVPFAACAVYEAFALLKPSAGQSTLIHGAGGGLGHFAVQLAKNAGLKIYGTARFSKHGFLAGYEIAGVLDREQPGWADHLMQKFPDGFDFILDTVGGLETVSDPLLHANGAYVSFSESPPEVATIQTGARTASLNALAEAIDAKRIKPHIEKIYSFAEGQKALERLATGEVKGKLVLAR